MPQNVEYIISLRDKFTKNLKNVNQSLKTTQKTASTFGTTLRNLAPVLGFAGIGMGVKSVIELGIEMEQTRVAFTTFLKDGEKANKLIADLNKFANITPFNNKEVIKSGRVLLSAQIPAEKIQKTLKAIGDVSAGANVPLTEMSAIYAKAMNKGRLQAEELNQLAERGVPILQTFSDMFGVSTQEVMKMGSEGKLTSALMVEAFGKMTNEGGIFFNLMEKQSATLGGKISTIQGKFQLLGQKIGENNGVLKGYADRIIKLADYLGNNIDKIEKLIKITVQAVKIYVLFKTTIFATQKAMKIATIANNALRISTIAYSRGIKSATKLTKGFNASLKANLIGLVVTGVVLLVTKIIELRKKTKAATDVNNKFNESLQNTKRLTTDIAGAGAKLKNLNLLTKEQKNELASLTREQLKNAENLRTDAKLAIVSSEKYKSLLDLQAKFKVGDEKTRGYLIGQMQNLERQIKETSEGQVLIESTKQVNLLKKRLETLKSKGVTGEGVMNYETKLDAKGEKLENTITSRSPKVINITINKVIETQEINTQNITESIPQIKRLMSDVLMDVINDSQLTSKAS